MASRNVFIRPCGTNEDDKKKRNSVGVFPNFKNFSRIRGERVENQPWYLESLLRQD
jgi:hypothetical protein